MSLRTSAAYIAVRIASGALAMLTLALVVRGLGPAGYGQLTLGLAAAAAVCLVLFNPLNASLARFYAQAETRAVVIRLLRRILLGLGGTLVLLAALASVAGWAPLPGGVLLAAACMALAQGMFDFSGQYLAAAQRSRRYSAQFLGKALLNLLLCVLAVQAGGGAAAVLAAMALAFALAALLGGEVWRLPVGAAPDSAGRSPVHPEPVEGLHPGDKVALAHFAGPLLLTSLLAYLTHWGDRYLLERLLPLAELGRYSAVMDLGLQTLGLVLVGLATAWYPRLVQAWGAGEVAEAQRLYGRYGALLLAVMLPAGLGFALLLPDLLPLLFGRAFADVPPALCQAVAALALLGGVKMHFLDQRLLLARRVWWHAASIGTAAACGLLLLWWLVPTLGVTGAALGLLLGQGAGALVSLWGGRDTLRLRLPMALLWPPVLASAALVAVLLAWSPATGWPGLLARIAAAVAAYGVVMLAADFDGLRARLCPAPAPRLHGGRRILLFANTDWFLFNFKRALAEALRARGDEVILLSPPGEYGPRLREAGFRWEALPVSRSGINPLAELCVLWQLWRCYRRWQPDLVHHFTIKCVIYGSLAARLARVRGVVNSVTGLGFALLAETPRARLIRPLVLMLYRLALRGSEVIFQNPDNRATLAAHGVLAHCRAQVIAGDGIDVARFAPLRMPEAQEGAGVPPLRPAVVLMMARLLHSKGVADFVAAARQVRAELPGVRFLLAGAPDPGNPESVDEAELAEWRAAGDVEFLGQRSDVLALNQSASVVVLASRQGEGIPRALLEGAACAVPLVATDVPGCREVVMAGETGLLVPPGEPARLAAALLELLGDDALRGRLGAAARAHVAKHFSDEVVIAQTCAVYVRALELPDA